MSSPQRKQRRPQRPRHRSTGGPATRVLDGFTPLIPGGYAIHGPDGAEYEIRELRCPGCGCFDVDLKHPPPQLRCYACGTVYGPPIA